MDTDEAEFADDPTAERDLVAQIVQLIADLEWQLQLEHPESIDIAIDAAEDLLRIYKELDDIASGNRVALRLQTLANTHRTAWRTRRINKILASFTVRHHRTAA